MAAENRSSPLDSQASGIDVPISIDPPPGDFATGGAAATELAADLHWKSLLRQAVRVAAQSQGFCRGQIGVLVTDDPTIQQINLRHLEHDYPTDVISFPYERDDRAIEGELVVSLCTARRWANEIGWDWRTELLLYAVHGTLHICGLEDSTAEQQQQMRLAERTVLSQLGIRDRERLAAGFEAELRREQGASEQ